jgi:predicted helicase
MPQKYAGELDCNELMLLPYYIASMNIEHEYFEARGTDQPFEGICLVDTFFDQKVRQLSLFTGANAARVERHRSSPIFVVVGDRFILYLGTFFFFLLVSVDSFCATHN